MHHAHDEINPEEQLDHAAYHAGLEMDENAPGTEAPVQADLEHAIAQIVFRRFGLDAHGMKAIAFRREVHACFAEHVAAGLVIGGGLAAAEEQTIRQETQGKLLSHVFGNGLTLPKRPRKGAPAWELSTWTAQRKAAMFEHFRLAFLRFVGLAKGFAPELLAHASLEEIGEQFGGLTRQDVCYHTRKIPGSTGSTGGAKLPYQKQPETVERCADAQTGNSSRLAGMTPPIAPPKLSKPQPLPVQP